MSVFIELTTDAFQARFDERMSEKKAQRRGAGATDVRRPLRGLEIKDDTYAIIKVVTSDGNEIKLVNSSAEEGKSTEYSNFIIQSVQEARMEKHQIVETFGDSYIFFFGEAPRFLDVQAILVDSHDFNWYAEFMENYDRYFRGTRLVEMGARTYLFYEDNIVEGYMLNTQAVKQSGSPLMVQLSFRLFLTNYSNVSLIGDPNFPIRGSLILPPEVGDVNKLDVDRGAYLATLGANLQQAGFGGGAQFQEAFASGHSGPAAAGVPAELYGIFLNASEALGDGTKHPERYQRKQPLRGKIQDNTDEYTFPRPSLSTGANEQFTKEDEVENLVAQAMAMLKLLGAQQNPPSPGEQAANYALRGMNPSLMNQLGLGPRFNNSGFPMGPGYGPRQPGFGAQSGTSASFGVRIGVNVGGGIGSGAGGRLGGGVGGGLGFSGRASAGYGLNGGFSAPYSPNIAAQQNQYGYSKRSSALNQLNQAAFGNQVDLNYFNSFNNSQHYTNGVRTNGGLTLGVGIAGGIGKPFRVETFKGTGPLPPGFPGTTVGNAVYTIGQPPPSGYGYNPYGSPYQPNYGPGPASFGYPGAPPNASFGGPGNGGANVFIGGRPTAFAMVSAGGTLNKNGLQTGSSTFSGSSF